MSGHPHAQEPRRLTRDDVLDGRDVAELLHIPISTVLEYARRGLLPARKLGRRWIFIRDEIEAAVRGGMAPIEHGDASRR
jgi:excisionase family DNA binding protein